MPHKATYGCPDHPDHGMLAVEQETFVVPVTILKEDGQMVVERSLRSEFVRDMATSATLAYMCAHPECAFSVGPDEIGQLSPRTD
jgi:hypothetical protein